VSAPLEGGHISSGPGAPGGIWSGSDWSRTRLGESSRRWAAGWDRSVPYPRDPGEDASPGRLGWRESCGLGGERWIPTHRRRLLVVGSLRAAGYQARKWGRSADPDRPRRVGWCAETGKPYERPDWRYLDGPAAGLPAVDPWGLAGRLSVCGSRWRAWLRISSSGARVLPIPDLCGAAHVCPVCASLRSYRLASALRLVLAARWGLADTAFVTLTQRAKRGETLEQSHRRWRAAWGRLTRGRPGRRWRRLVLGSFYGVELTRGAGASRTKRGPHWHVHGHAILRLAPGVVPSEIGALWVQATRGAARGLGYARPEHWGWDPVAGVQVDGETAGEARGRIASGDWSGPWWEWFEASAIPAPPPDVDPAAWARDRMESGEADRLCRSRALARVYQAAKYPSPVADLCPRSLAEFVAVAHGRRWHDGSGIFRGAIRQARELSRYRPDRPVDLGRNVSRGGPHDLPSLDSVSPGLGEQGPVRVVEVRKQGRWVPAVESASASVATEAEVMLAAMGETTRQRSGLGFPSVGARRDPRTLVAWSLVDLSDDDRASLEAAGLELFEGADGPRAMASASWARSAVLDLQEALAEGSTSAGSHPRPAYRVP